MMQDSIFSLKNKKILTIISEKIEENVVKLEIIIINKTIMRPQNKFM